jgi:hypothetical protein
MGAMRIPADDVTTDDGDGEKVPHGAGDLEKNHQLASRVDHHGYNNVNIF